jgi:hypothetical protein
VTVTTFLFKNLATGHIVGGVVLARDGSRGQVGFVVTLEPQAAGSFGELGPFFADRPVAPKRFAPLRRWFS